MYEFERLGGTGTDKLKQDDVDVFGIVKRHNLITRQPISPRKLAKGTTKTDRVYRGKRERVEGNKHIIISTTI